MKPMLDLSQKNILITGGTGSFGRNFVKFLLARTNPKKIIILSRDELKQHHLQQEFTDSRLRFLIGDVRDVARLRRAFFGVDMVVHAAALKQVPALEYNPVEAVKTNIIGSQNVIEAAIDEGVGRTLLISTDKAAYPVSLYGSTKLCAEKLFVAANSYGRGIAKFSVARYGNVLGSRGSIVETLLRNRAGQIVQVTHEEMTRFWINYEQTCQLVSYALTEMVGGEIFIPKIPSMKLIDLIDTIVPESKKEIIGMRPGEKLHEVLLTDQEARHAVELEKYYVVLPEFPFWGEEGFQKYHTQKLHVNPLDSYLSNTNKLWLTSEELKALLEILN